MLDISKYQSEWVELSGINVENNQFQFRESLAEDGLAKSLADDGQTFPVLVLERADGRRQLIGGFRRVNAAMSLGWEKILAQVIPEADLSEDEALRLNFIENIERKTLTNLDIMFACRKLKGQGKTNVEIGKLIGKDEKQVRRYIKVTEKSEDVRVKLANGEITIDEASNGAIGLESD